MPNNFMIKIMRCMARVLKLLLQSVGHVPRDEEELFALLWDVMATAVLSGGESPALSSDNDVTDSDSIHGQSDDGGE